MGDDFEMDKASMPPEAVQIEFATNTPTNHVAEKSKAEKKLVRKTDWLVPAILGGAYFFAYLVRSYFGANCIRVCLLTAGNRTGAPLATPVLWACKQILGCRIKNTSTA
jgi:hypothetical protein